MVLFVLFGSSFHSENNGIAGAENASAFLEFPVMRHARLTPKYLQEFIPLELTGSAECQSPRRTLAAAATMHAGDDGRTYSLAAYFWFWLSIRSRRLSVFTAFLASH